MRPTLFLSSLFVVSLVSGVALAEKPHRPVDRLRSHGDMIDKNYRGSDKASPQAAQGAVAQARQTKSPVDKASSRINCSDAGGDCSAAGKPDGGASRAGGL